MSDFKTGVVKWTAYEKKYPSGMLDCTTEGQIRCLSDRLAKLEDQFYYYLSNTDEGHGNAGGE